MKEDALFLNGVYQEVLEEILLVQEELPEQIMFLQPYKSHTINMLRETPPSVDDPVWLLISLTTDLPTVHYVAQIVGWNDKRSLSEAQRQVLNRLISTLQPKEGGLYNLSQAEGGQSINLLHVRRLHRLTAPFSVTRLIKSDGKPVSDRRTTAGSWTYVRTEGLETLLSCLRELSQESIAADVGPAESVEFTAPQLMPHSRSCQSFGSRRPWKHAITTTSSSRIA